MKNQDKQIIPKIRRVVREELAGKVPDLKQWFRIKEAALMFGVSECTIMNWLDEGTLEARRVSLSSKKRKHIRITRESIIRVLKDRKREIA